MAKGPLSIIPIPSFNVINGGRNGKITQAFNEFIVMPFRAVTIDRAVEIAVKVFQKLGKVVEKHFGEALVGRSYGWVAPSEDPEVCLDLIQEAIDACGYTKECAFCFDCASSEMYDAATKTYYLNGRRVTSDEQIAYMKRLTESWKYWKKFWQPGATGRWLLAGS